MKANKVLLIVFATCFFNCQSQNFPDRIEIVQPSIEQEATSIWNTINNISFFEKQGYNIRLPKDSEIDELIGKSRKGTFQNTDYSTIYMILEEKLFNPEDYELAKHNIVKQKGLLNKFLNEIDSRKNNWDWKFKMFEKYKIVLTLYGTGGSYDPDNGIITLLTNKDGGFIKYKNPANTIIHEITHIGVEDSIIQRYNLSHVLKERIIDNFVIIMFGSELPEYEVQSMGDNSIDQYLNKQDHIDSLNFIIRDFIKSK